MVQLSVTIRFAAKGDIMKIPFLKKKTFLETDEVDSPIDYSLEPKRKFRWVVQIEGIPSFVVKRAQRPTAYRGTDGAVSYGPLHIVAYDPISPSVSETVWDWFSTGEKRDGMITLLNPKGEVLERWRFKELNMTYLNLGDLDYSSSDPIEIEMQFYYSYVEHITE